MAAHGRAEERMPAILSVQQIRVVEIVSIFFIVFIAREIAGFVFRTELVISVFLGATFLNLLAAGLENAFARGERISVRRRETWEWATVLIDSSTAIALIYLTGTAQSPFLFLVVIPLFFAGRLLPPVRAGLMVTGFSIGALAVLGYLEMRGVVPFFSCYPGETALPADGRFLAGTLLILGGFMGFMTYLFSNFYENFKVYVHRAEDRLLNSRKRILELTRLYDISLGINSVISLDTLLKMVCKEITLLLRRPWVSIVLINQKREVIEHVELGRNGVVSLEPGTPLADDPLIIDICAHETGLIIDDMREQGANARSPLVADRALGSFLAVPVYLGQGQPRRAHGRRFRPRAVQSGRRPAHDDSLGPGRDGDREEPPLRGHERTHRTARQGERGAQELEQAQDELSLASLARAQDPAHVDQGVRRIADRPYRRPRVPGKGRISRNHLGGDRAAHPHGQQSARRVEDRIRQPDPQAHGLQSRHAPRRGRILDAAVPARQEAPSRRERSVLAPARRRGRRSREAGLHQSHLERDQVLAERIPHLHRGGRGRGRDQDHGVGRRRRHSPGRSPEHLQAVLPGQPRHRAKGWASGSRS